MHGNASCIEWLRPTAALPNHGCGKLGIQPDGLLMGLKGFLVATEVGEGTSLPVPGGGVLGIQPDGLVIGLKGFLIKVGGIHAGFDHL